MPPSNEIEEEYYDSAKQNSSNQVHTGVNHEVEEDAPQQCGPMATYPVTSVLAFALCGIAVGIGLSQWDADEGGDTRKNMIQWVGLIGDLFIRALKAVVLPLVFINVIISVLEMLDVGKVRIWWNGNTLLEKDRALVTCFSQSRFF